MKLTSAPRAMMCRKCGGRLVRDGDESYCLMCGFVDYGVMPPREDPSDLDQRSSLLEEVSLPWQDERAA